MVFVSLMFGVSLLLGGLALWRLGEKKWSLIDDGAEKSHFDDVIYYKGRFYAIDYIGRIVVIDADSLKATELASPVHVAGVFKFIEEEQKWDWVSGIGDRVLFVDDDRTFSLSSTDFPGFKGTAFISPNTVSVKKMMIVPGEVLKDFLFISKGKLSKGYFAEVMECSG
ncbi:hypothetical protein CK203_066572 [Vitis vinifera]|uniref:KIB1-4 beta-propeller domain-containing protein n=1 Tax=Vitis vinifera TaxID=29760 RepID=A0A438EUX9_VITVI|nr:hypothetical protein CK203_066572 [Vitis vinifera]